MNCPAWIMVLIMASTLAIFSVSVDSRVGVHTYTSDEDKTIEEITNYYLSEPPAKALAIARDLSGGWVAYISYGNPDLASARIRALQGCKVLAQNHKVQGMCHIRKENDPIPPPRANEKPPAKFFPYRLTGLSYPLPTAQSWVDGEITKCGAHDRARETEGVHFINREFLLCIRERGYSVDYDVQRTTAGCKWVDLSDIAPRNDYRGELRCGPGRQPRPSVSQTSPVVTPLAPADRLKLVPSKLVREVQKRLRQLGYNPGPVDGVLGPNTVAAVKAFQRDLDVTPTGIVSDELLFALNVMVAVQEAPKPIEEKAELKLAGTGSGFYVNSNGYALTNYHVIEGCAAVAVNIGGKSQQVELVATDESNDLALLKGSGVIPNFARFRESRQVFLGESVLVAGYPLKGILAESLNVSTGAVSSLAGIGDDARYLQMSAPVQPGNSGGPLLDKSAAVIGIVVGKLSLKVAKITGAIPENVNFAIKAVIARGFLDIHGIEYQTVRPTQVLDATKIAAAAGEFTVPIECWK